MKPRAKVMKLDKAIDLLLDQSFSSDEEELEDSDQSSVSETQNGLIQKRYFKLFILCFLFKWPFL